MNPPPAAAVTVYAAEAMPSPDGTVEWWGSPLSDADATSRLQSGQDIVVRGAERPANRNKARQLMVAGYGGAEPHEPHKGRMALPHFHPPGCMPPGIHAFYETTKRHARRRT
jgi:hypothetical protein